MVEERWSTNLPVASKFKDPVGERMNKRSNLKLFACWSSDSNCEKILLSYNSAMTPLPLFSKEMESSGEMDRAS